MASAMDESNIRPYVRSTATLLNVALDVGRENAVVAVMTRLAAMADHLLAFPLDADEDPTSGAPA